MGFALTASPFCQTATKGTKKALPCHTAVSLWLDGAFTPALLRGHAVTGHPWPSTAGSAPADPPPQQHLRSACCEGLLCRLHRLGGSSEIALSNSNSNSNSVKSMHDLRKERLGSRAFGCVEEVVGRRVFDDHAAIEEQHAFGHLPRKPHFEAE